jgi:hypothetical protein
VGSSGMKKRRKGPAKTQHLQKVGTHSNNTAAHEQELERQAVLDTMGMGNLGSTGKVVVWIVFGLIAVFAIVALLVLTVL